MFVVYLSGNCQSTCWRPRLWFHRNGVCSSRLWTLLDAFTKSMMRMFVTCHVFCWFFSPGAPCWGCISQDLFFLKPFCWMQSSVCPFNRFFLTVELRMICSSTLHAIQVRETGLIIVWWIVSLSFLADWWEKCIPPLSQLVHSQRILSVFLNIDQTLKKAHGYWKCHERVKLSKICHHGKLYIY